MTGAHGVIQGVMGQTPLEGSLNLNCDGCAEQSVPAAGSYEIQSDSNIIKVETLVRPENLNAYPT